MDQKTPEVITEKIPSAETPSISRNASWGAIISIVIILLMVTVGAFYAWGQRLAELRAVKAVQQQQTVSF